MAHMENYPNGKQTKWNNLNGRDLNGRRPKWKTTKMEDGQNGRRPKFKTTKMEKDQNGKQQNWKRPKLEMTE